jgi:hypothetical protein
VDIWKITNDSIQAAKSAGIITDMDEGAVAVLLQMAQRLDDVEYPIIDGKFDNVTQSLYFKACEQLGLTPAGRNRLEEKKGASGGKLAQLRSLQGGATPKPAGRKRTG